MKSRKESVTIELTSTLHLLVNGIFTPRYNGKWTTFAESEPEEPAEFEITEIQIEKGDIIELIDYFDGYCSKEVAQCRETTNTHKFYFPTTIWQRIEDLCIEKIENE